MIDPRIIVQVLELGRISEFQELADAFGAQALVSLLGVSIETVQQPQRRR
jgi:hypothetical protein